MTGVPIPAVPENPAPVLVGTDGSPAALRAVRFAARAAARRGVDLVILHSEAGPPDGYGPLADWTPENTPDGHAAHVLTEARRHALAAVGPASVTVRLQTAGGRPAPALVEASARAALTVVGRDATHSVGAYVPGSAALQVAAHAQGPVVVVPVSPDPAPDGPGVVLGVDDGEFGQRAVEFAFEEASRLGLPLTAVRGWTLLSEEPLLHAPVPGPDDLEDDQRRLVSECLAGWRAKYPDVAVEVRLVQWHPASVLTDAAEGAALLVLGARGAGGFAGLHLGSVADAVVRHAPCPTAVVR
jgi:nucleotide-binding universal stress UspA family protein